MTSFKHPPKGYAFIVTYGRSGSTLLQSLINRVPGYQIRGENNDVLFSFYRAWCAVKESEPLTGMRKNGQESEFFHPWYGGEKIDPDTFGQDIAGFFTRTILQPDPDVRVSGFKEIRFHSKPAAFMGYMTFIHTFFPNAKFIFNTRDHASVARSGWWAERDPAEVSATLTGAEALYTRYIDRFPERSLHLHYDDYVADRTKLKALYDFLQEPYDPNIVDLAMDKRLDHARGKGTKT